MKNLIKKIAVGAVILGSLTSCTAYSDAYSNNNQSPYYNANYNNGYYYAPSSYYGNGGYYGNDGYYYRNNMNYQYDNNVPYYYGNNQRKIYVQRQAVSQRQPNGLHETGDTRVRNNSNVTPDNVRGNRSNDSGFRNTSTPSATPQRNTNSSSDRYNETRTQDNNNQGLRNTDTPQPAQTSSRSGSTRDGSR